jgi:hypothetical protein
MIVVQLSASFGFSGVNVPESIMVCSFFLHALSQAFLIYQFNVLTCMHQFGPIKISLVYVK